MPPVLSHHQNTLNMYIFYHIELHSYDHKSSPFVFHHIFLSFIHNHLQQPINSLLCNFNKMPLHMCLFHPPRYLPQIFHIQNILSPKFYRLPMEHFSPVLFSLKLFHLLHNSLSVIPDFSSSSLYSGYIEEGYHSKIIRYHSVQ